MRVIVTKRFIDKNTGKLREVGEVFTCNKERFAEITAAGAYVEEVKTEKEN